MTWAEVKRMLKKLGCKKVKEGANHERWQGPTGNPFPVGRHDSQEVPTRVVEAILKEAGIK